MENNTAFVAKLTNIQPIVGADKIVFAGVNLEGVEITRVVVGVETVENTPVIYFDSNMCIEQDIIDRLDKLHPEYGTKDFKSMGNYLSKGNRVRCIKLKGTISNGLIVEVAKFEKLFPTISFREGFSFTELDGTKVCQKYTVPIKVQSQGNGNKKRKGRVISRVIENQFAFHIDTSQLLRNLHRINPNNLISVSRKIHGTSFITGNNLVLKKLSFIENLLKKAGINVVDKEYDYLYASRSVVKNGELAGTGFYSENIWTRLGEENFKGKLRQGETVYGEAYGYLNNGSYIQKHYDYGVEKGKYALVIYRITQTTPDGVTREYSWNQIKKRCVELGVPMVHEFYYGLAKDMYKDIEVDENWAINFAERLKKDYLEKDVTENLSGEVPDEGIVIKIDEGDPSDIFKLKSEKFYNFETKAAEAGDENLEDEESAIESAYDGVLTK